MHGNNLIIPRIFVGKRAGSAANADRLTEHETRQGSGGYCSVCRSVIDLTGNGRARDRERCFMHRERLRNIRRRIVIHPIAGLRSGNGTSICRNNVHGRTDNGARTGRYRKGNGERGICGSAYGKIRIAVGLVGQRRKGDGLRNRIRMCHRSGNTEEHQAKACRYKKAGSTQKARK